MLTRRVVVPIERRHCLTCSRVVGTSPYPLRKPSHPVVLATEQLGVSSETIALANCGTSAHYSIHDVVGLRSPEEVIWAAARHPIATMSRYFPARSGRYLKNPPRNRLFTPLDHDLGVVGAVGLEVPVPPDPATVLVYLAYAANLFNESVEIPTYETQAPSHDFAHSHCVAIAASNFRFAASSPA